MTPSMMAASATDLVIGPAVSWSSVNGMMPWRLMRPVEGRMPTSIVKFDGPSIDPPVLVPTLPAHRLAATPPPELEPLVSSTGVPSSLARGSYGL